MRSMPSQILVRSVPRLPTSTAHRGGTRRAGRAGVLSSQNGDAVEQRLLVDLSDLRKLPPSRRFRQDAQCGEHYR